MIDDEWIVGFKVRGRHFCSSWHAFRFDERTFVIFIGFTRWRDGRYRCVCILSLFGRSSRTSPALRLWAHECAVVGRSALLGREEV